MGDSPKKTKVSAGFKAGTISIAFIVIGYQSALLVDHAAELRIVSNRDRPDTVYVVREQAREGEEERIVSVQRHPSEHHELARRTYERSPGRKVETFRFNPNTVSLEDLRRLGFTEKQAQSIDAYRQKGGRFRRSSDFAKSYVVSDSVFRRLEPYIDIPKTDINKADSAAFDALPGIGPYFAAKMVSFREELGGYSSTEQLMDIYNFDREKYDALKDLVTCSPPDRPFRLWSLPVDSLRLHPYVRSWQRARSIVFYRDHNPPENLTVEGLLKAGILDSLSAARLSRCAIAPPER